MENIEHKLQVPFWEVVVHDKYEDEAWVWRYRTEPGPIQWVLDFYDDQNDQNPIFEYDEETKDHYNRVGDRLSEMIVWRQDGWDINITSNGQDVYGLKAYCRKITRLQWKD